MENMELHERIAAVRKGAGLSQEQLGEKLGVSRQAVSKWESGQSNPDLQYIISMCRLFDVSTDWLLTGEEGQGEAPPRRCVGCNAIITPMDDFCSKCGRPLHGNESPLYTIVLREAQNPPVVAKNLRRMLMKYGLMPHFPVKEKRNDDDYLDAVSHAPMIACHGAKVDEAQAIFRELQYHAIVEFYRCKNAASMSDLVADDQITFEQLVKVEERERGRPSLSFGETVAAVVVGVVVALFLLSIF